MTTTYNPRLIWLITAGGFFSFFAFGFLDNLKGPLLPELLRDLEFSYSQGGTILLGTYLGFLIATLITGVLADRYGNGTVLIIAGVCLVLGMVAFSYGDTFTLLFISMMIFGLGLGAIEVGGNGLIVELYDAERGRYLNLLAAFHGIGALLAPIYVAQLLQIDFTWRQIFRLSIILAGLLAVCFIVLPYRRSTSNLQSEKTQPTPGLTRLLRTGFAWPMPLYYLLIVFYVSAELGIASWLVEFLQQAKSFTVGSSAFYLSLFFGCIMVGRLIGSVLVDRIGYLHSMLYATLAAIFCLVIGHWGPNSIAFFIPVAGLFFSIIFPTTTAAVSKLHPENTGTILGLFFTFGGLGGALGPWAMGIASDRAGIEGGFILPIAYCGLIAAALLMLLLDDKKRG